MTTTAQRVAAPWRVTVIGSGQLAQSYLAGLVASGFSADRCIGVRRREAPVRFAPADGGHPVPGVAWTTQLDRVPLDVTVLAIKPKDLGSLAQSMRDAGRRPGLLLSTLACVRAAELERHFAPSVAVVRCMPNLGVAARRSSTLVWPYPGLRDDVREVVDALFGSVGTLWPMATEEQLDACTAVSAAGLAYVARMARALARAGERLGLSEPASAAIAREICVATGALMAPTWASPDLLMAGVASPGGMTERALRHLDDELLDDRVFEAICRSLSSDGTREGVRR